MKGEGREEGEHTVSSINSVSGVARGYKEKEVVIYWRVSGLVSNQGLE